jgi:hypothetical protein
MLLFLKLVDEAKISKPQDLRTTFKQILACIFLSVIPKLLVTFQYEIPCIVKAHAVVEVNLRGLRGFTLQKVRALV